MDLKTMHFEYLKFVYHSKSVATFKYDKELFKRLERFYDSVGIKDSEDINASTINDMVVWFKVNTLCQNKSINKHIKILKQLYKFFNIDFTYLLTYPMLKEKRIKIETISKHDQKILFEYLKTYKNEDYKTMIYLMYDTGLRLSELLNIKKIHVNLEEKCIYIPPRKTDLDRFVFYRSFTAYYLKEMIKSHDSEYLFFNQLRNRMYIKSDIKLMFRRLREATGIKKLYCHLFRHTLATELIENGCMLTAVQKQLGHAKITTTMLYVHLSTKVQKEEYYKTKRKRV